MEEKIDKRLELIKFSYSFSIGMLILSGVLFLRKANSILILLTISLSGYHLLAAVLFPFLSLWTNFLMKQIFKIFSFLLTQVVFSMIYYLIITPFAIFVRLTKKDTLAFKKESVWVIHEDNNPDNVKKQF